MEHKRLTLFAGHYGSGKTNIAVNLAFEIRKQFEKVAIADLDIVNPYFRTKDSAEEIKKADIKLIVSEYAGTNVDIPALPQDMYSLTDDKSVKAVIDDGGDDRGALALGRLSDAIKLEDDYEMLLVINKFRPLTPDVESTLEVMNEIETACKIKFTGIVNNSNLGEMTEPSDVLNSMQYANDVAKATGLPIKFTAVNETLYNSVKGEISDLFPLKLQKKIN